MAVAWESGSFFRLLFGTFQLRLASNVAERYETGTARAILYKTSEKFPIFIDEPASCAESSTTNCPFHSRFFAEFFVPSNYRTRICSS